MRAQSLQVNLLGPCNARCPFCIAKSTWKTGVEDNEGLFRGLEKCLGYARYHRVDSVMITGTGEPTLLDDAVAEVVSEARRLGFPSIELQTNGMLLAQEPRRLETLAKIGLTGLAVSTAHPDPYQNQMTIGVTHDYLDLLSKASGMGLLTRVTLNLVNNCFNTVKLADWADILVSRGIHQLTLRELGIPDVNPLDTVASERARAWTEANRMLEREVHELRRDIRQHGHLVRTTAFGVEIYDYHGLSTCVSPSCLIENTSLDEIRSMILQPDGYIYSSWSLPGSILI